MIKSPGVRPAAGADRRPGTPPQPARAPLPPAGAERIIAVAARQAAAILEFARRDAAEMARAVRAEAQDSGYAAGRTAGRAEALEAARQEAQAVVAAARVEAARLLQGAEERVGLLACEIATHLIGTELRQSPETIERAVAQTLAQLGTPGDLAVEVAPGDYEQAVRSVGSWREVIGAQSDIRVSVDPALPRGGYRVLGPSGAVERNWQDGIAAIARAFEEVARRGV